MSSIYQDDVVQLRLTGPTIPAISVASRPVAYWLLNGRQTTLEKVLVLTVDQNAFARPNMLLRNLMQPTTSFG